PQVIDDLLDRQTVFLEEAVQLGADLRLQQVERGLAAHQRAPSISQHKPAMAKAGTTMAARMHRRRTRTVSLRGSAASLPERLHAPALRRGRAPSASPPARSSRFARSQGPAPV